MTQEIDPIIDEHVAAIANRFGVDGLRQAAALIAAEIAAYDGVYANLADA